MTFNPQTVYLYVYDYMMISVYVNIYVFWNANEGYENSDKWLLIICWKKSGKNNSKLVFLEIFHSTRFRNVFWLLALGLTTWSHLSTLDLAGPRRTWKTTIRIETMNSIMRSLQVPEIKIKFNFSVFSLGKIFQRYLRKGNRCTWEFR